MKKETVLQEAYLNILVIEELINEYVRKQKICQKLANLASSDLDDEFFQGCSGFDDAMNKFELRYGFLLKK
ncbi:MAG: hypothetical protein ACTTJC_02015 [Campylobacter sp.]